MILGEGACEGGLLFFMLLRAVCFWQEWHPPIVNVAFRHRKRGI